MKHKKEEIYLDLSKLSESERKEIELIIVNHNNIKCDFDLEEKWGDIVFDNDGFLCWSIFRREGKKEINFQQFCELFQEVSQVENSIESLRKEFEDLARLKGGSFLMESSNQNYINFLEKKIIKSNN